MRVIAPAKINLTLHVTGKREDGYHLLHSLVAFTHDFGDEIEITPASEFKFTQGGDDELLPKSDDNLIVKTAQALAAHYDRPLPFHIHLNKKIPIGAGLGGGSSDAAATIKALIERWEIKPEQEDLQKLMLSLGADIPLCFHGQACLMEGIGDIITPIELEAPLAALLVYPHEFTSTPEVFKNFKSSFSTPNNKNDIWEMVKAGSNDLTPSAVEITPIIQDVLKEIELLEGCVIASMSGSGSSCFGLFDNTEASEQAAKILKNKKPDWWVQAIELS